MNPLRFSKAMDSAGGDDMALKKARKDIQYETDDRFQSSLPHFRWIRRTFPSNNRNHENPDESKEGSHSSLVSSRVILD
jgi:hypothetical protein